MSTTSLVDHGDPENAPGNIDELENSLREAVASPPQDEDKGKKDEDTSEEGKVEKPDYIHEKFWTGDIEESLRKQYESHKSLESAYGRMANDLGTQRKLTDRLLALDKRASDLGEDKEEAPSLPKIDARELIDNPDETLSKYLSAREEHLRKKLEEEQRLTFAQQQEQEFLQRHPDYEEVATSEEFAQWVTSSPLRQRAAQLAAGGDYSVADEMLTEFKALQGQGPAPAKSQDPDVEAAKKVATESAAQASGGERPKGKIYRRADLIQLKLEKPEVYSDPSFQEEIMRAYAEGRVK